MHVARNYCVWEVKKINFRRNLQGNFLSAPPAHQVHTQAEQKAIFRTLFAGRGIFGGLFNVYLVISDPLLRATTKKGHILFVWKIDVLADAEAESEGDDRRHRGKPSHQHRSPAKKNLSSHHKSKSSQHHSDRKRHRSADSERAHKKRK